MTETEGNAPEKEVTKYTTAERRARAVELRARSFSLRQIANTLGCSSSQVKRDLDRHLDEINESNREGLVRLRSMQQARYEYLLRKLEPAIRNSDRKAIETAAGIVSRLSRLYGLETDQTTNVIAIAETQRQESQSRAASNPRGTFAEVMALIDSGSAQGTDPQD